MGVVLKPKIVRKKQKEPYLKQIILEVYPNKVKVQARNGNTYVVGLSDKVLLREIEEKDFAIIDPKSWLVVDIEKQKKKKVLTPQEEEEEYQRQLKEFEELVGYY